MSLPTNNLSQNEQFLDLELVKKVAKSLFFNLPNHIQLDDLIQAGTLGLIAAIEKFDATKKVKFSTFASIKIRGAIIDELRKLDWAPRSVYKNNRMINEATSILENKKGAAVNDTDIANFLKMNINDYYKLQQDKNCTYMNSIDDESNIGLVASKSQYEPDCLSMQANFKQSLAKIIASLPVNERLVLFLHYDEEQNLKSISEILGVTESRVSQIHRQAIKKLRDKCSTL